MLVSTFNFHVQLGESQAGMLLLQWRLLRRRRQVGRVLQRDSGLLSGLGQQRRWQGFSGHGHEDFVVVSYIPLHLQSRE